jgi:hypothetical protein
MSATNSLASVVMIAKVRTHSPEVGLSSSCEKSSALAVQVHACQPGQLRSGNRPQEEPDEQWKAAAFARWHEPDESRGSRPESVMSSMPVRRRRFFGGASDNWLSIHSRRFSSSSKSSKGFFGFHRIRRVPGPVWPYSARHTRPRRRREAHARVVPMANAPGKCGALAAMSSSRFSGSTKPPLRS